MQSPPPDPLSPTPLYRLQELLEDRTTACREVAQAARDLEHAEQAVLQHLRWALARIYNDWRPWVGSPVVRVSYEGEDLVTSLFRVYAVAEEEIVVTKGQESSRVRVRRDKFIAPQEDEPFELFLPVSAFNAEVRHWFDLPEVPT